MSGTGRRLDGDRGTTLAEMLVALIVFSVFATFLTTTVVQTTRMVKTSSQRENGAQRAGVVMQQISRDVRTAVRVGPPSGTQVAFVTATETELVFYSNVDPTILRERLYVSGGELFRETKLPDVGSTFPDLTFTSTDPTRTTTRRLVGTALQSAGLFAYTVKGSATPVTTVPAASLKDVVAVDVQVSVDPDGTGSLKPVVITTTVRPYNP
jgi:prepilin-type N-terminal cleavage/methylation domain-containing protein